jgi:hypothetical protein
LIGGEQVAAVAASSDERPRARATRLTQRLAMLPLEWTSAWTLAEQVGRLTVKELKEELRIKQLPLAV